MFPNHCATSKNGFILVVTILIIGLMVLLLAGSLIISSLYSRRNSSVYINKNQTLALSLACAEEALFQIKQNTAFVGTNNLTINGRTCGYTVTNTGGDNRQVTISSNIANVFTKTFITLTVSPTPPTINILSWKDVADF